MSSDSHIQPSAYLIDEKDLKRTRKLGSGCFGVVHEAIWNKNHGETKHCAVKQLRDASKELLSEIRNMMGLNHKNIVRLYGMVLADPPLMVIEYCDGGSLDKRLIGSPKLLVTDLREFAVQIAQGMVYLASKKIVHRDLAARNVLMLKDKTIKIADFGLARKPDDRSSLKAGGLPFRWTALECFLYNSHKTSPTEYSDVWSFGVTLWEMYTYGKQPYEDLCSYSNIVLFLQSGKRLRKPDAFPKDLFESLMLKCWLQNPSDRPNFETIENILQSYRPNIVSCDAQTSLSDKLLEIKKNDQIILIDKHVNSGSNNEFVPSEPEPRSDRTSPIRSHDIGQNMRSNELGSNNSDNEFVPPEPNNGTCSTQSHSPTMINQNKPNDCGWAMHSNLDGRNLLLALSEDQPTSFSFSRKPEPSQELKLCCCIVQQKNFMKVCKKFGVICLFIVFIESVLGFVMLIFLASILIICGAVCRNRIWFLLSSFFLACGVTILLFHEIYKWKVEHKEKQYISFDECNWGNRLRPPFEECKHWCRSPEGIKSGFDRNPICSFDLSTEATVEQDTSKVKTVLYISSLINWTHIVILVVAIWFSWKGLKSTKYRLCCGLNKLIRK